MQGNQYIKDPEVAIVTRTKNRNLFLKRSLDSIKLQSYGNFIHVIVNDGGDKEAVNKIITKYSHNIKVIHNDKSVGLTKALNQGIRAVNTKYVFILDDDDTWSPNRLEKTVEHFEQYPNSQACVVKMDVVEEDVIGDKIVTIKCYPHPDSNDGEISLFKQCNRNYLSNGVLAFKKEVFAELGGYDESLETAEDWDFGLRLLLKYDVDFIKTDDALVFYHQRPREKNVYGNAVIARVNSQEVTLNKIRNKYLRNDISKGVVGIGYIMNQIAFDLTSIVRIEGHINYSKNEAITEINKNIRSTLIDSKFSNRFKKKVQRKNKS